jgi:hypothetical protein
MIFKAAKKCHQGKTLNKLELISENPKSPQNHTFSSSPCHSTPVYVTVNEPSSRLEPDSKQTESEVCGKSKTENKISVRDYF